MKSPSALLVVQTAQPTRTEEVVSAHLIMHMVPSSRDNAVGLQPRGGQHPQGGIEDDGKSRVLK